MSSCINAFDLNKIKSIDKITKYIVFGYIHQYEIENDSYFIMPDLIIYIILIYYEINEYSTVYGQDIKYDEKTNTLRNIKIQSEGTIYGDINILDENKNGIIYEWKFKIISNKSKNICIGIDSSNKQFIHNDFSRGNYNKYAFFAYGDGTIYYQSNCGFSDLYRL